LVDLKDCIEKIENNSEGNVRKRFRACKVTQWAVDDNGADVEENNFYTLVLSLNNGNVSVGEDIRGLAELEAQFPTVSSETIESVWNTQHTWDACFGVLSSLVDEHQSLCVSGCHSFLDNVLWPALAVGNTNPDNEWSILELDPSLDALAVEIEKSKLTEGWQILDPAEIPAPEPKLTFKDVVLKGEALERELPALVPLSRTRAPWQPRFEIKAAKKIRVDKHYVGQVPATTTLDDDEDFDGSYFESQTFLKGSVGVTRKMAVTKVRPKALDQKMKRIAEKAKV